MVLQETAQPEVIILHLDENPNFSEHKDIDIHIL